MLIADVRLMIEKVKHASEINLNDHLFKIWWVFTRTNKRSTLAIPHGLKQGTEVKQENG